MSDSQAAHLTESWLVVAPTFTDSASGVSATLFQNKLTGEISLAIRGTEPSLTDIGADGLLAIGISSKLNPQFTALKTQIDIWLAPGGLLNGQAFSVTGHSLGGYLAAAVKEQYPADVMQAYLYNAPGFGGVFGELLSGIGVIGAGDGTGISNLVGSEGLSVISGLGVPAAPPVSVLIEPAGGMGTANHSIVTLTDSLAVYALYDKFAPSSDIAMLSGLLDANTNDKSLTLEASLDTLRELFTGITLDANTRTPAMVDATTRDRFYTNLYNLQNSATYQSLSGQVTLVPLGGMKDVEMAAAAQSGIAYRYALVNGNAFAVVGNDAIYAQHNTNGELNLYDATTGTGEITDTYLKERAAFVERKLYYGEHDLPYTYTTSIPVGATDPYIAESILWQDRTDGITIEHPGATANTRRVIFGSDAGETDITGANAADALFGGGGDDKLTGGQGNDYLEGGQGNDTYVYTSGDGLDTILDSGGQNTLAVDGATLAGGAEYGDARVHRDANGHLYIETGGKMVIDGNIVIQNYGSGGTFGLAMTGAVADIDPQTTQTFVGDLAPIDQSPNAGIQLGYDSLGNVITDPDTPEPGRADSLFDSSANDRITSGGDRTRRRTRAAIINSKAANDEATQAWRVAA